jgi:Uncharacterized protein conserved in bacteria (DUF2252)
MISRSALRIEDATAQYDAWVAAQVPVSVNHLAKKHELMHADASKFLRGTYYRWATRFRAVAGSMADGAPVLSVGDAHIENFGTWRDAEGRLAWGVNDVDEASPVPQSNDPLRVLTSALLARHKLGGRKLALRGRSMSDAVLGGYMDSLRAGGIPYVLAETHGALRELALARVHDPEGFWRKLESSCVALTVVPARVQALLRQSLPADVVIEQWATRAAGIGSLVHARTVVLGRYGGARIAREAKRIAPSSAAWARGDGAGTAQGAALLAHAIRSPDPLLRFDRSGWIVRRLAPDCSRIDLSALDSADAERHLLHAMGAELANMQLGQRSAVALRKRAATWRVRAMLDTAEQLRDDVLGDWRAWRQTRGAE